MGRSGALTIGGKARRALVPLAVACLTAICAAPHAWAKRAETPYQHTLSQVYDQMAATPFTYRADEIEHYGQAAMKMSGEARIYALWRVFYAYKNDQNQTKLNLWHDRVAALARKEGDVNLDLLARFMLQAYDNEASLYTGLTDREWSDYLAASDDAIHSIVSLERVRQLQYNAQYAEAIDMAEGLILHLQSRGPASQGLLMVAQQNLAAAVLAVGDYNAYADHMLSVARLANSNAFFLQKMDIVYELASFAASDNDIPLADHLQKLYAGYVAHEDVSDLKAWDQELCALVNERAEDFSAVVTCLKGSNAARGVVVTPYDAVAVRHLVRAYAHLYDTAKARHYLQVLQSVPASVYPRDVAFDVYIDAYLKAGDGHPAEAFKTLAEWSTDLSRKAETRRIDGIKEMYLALRKELDRKAAESRQLTKEIEARTWLLGAVFLIAMLLAAFSIVVWMGVQRMRRMQASLTLANEHAEAANAAKSRFLAVMSHELRTPLNGVLGMAQALKKEDLTDTQQEQVDVLVDSGKTLMVLLNDVLDMSRIEAGKIELAPTTATMRDMVVRVINTYSALLQGKPVVLRSEFSPGADKAMTFDVLRVYQCLSNLVSNAIKFTEKGSVRLIVSAEPIIPDGGYLVRVEVRDTGIGMSQATVDRLFEAYNQADASTARQYGGSGLGLNISRRLTELMGGTLGVTSEEGVGSSFVMTFKAGEAVQAAVAEEEIEDDPVAAPRPEGTRILLVDDHPVNRKVARLFLEPFGYQITEAVDGQAALDVDMSGFDLVLMDLNMPRLGGLDATRAFRATEKPGCHVPIVALTADAMPDQVAACYDAGMDAHVSKPILMDKLIETVGGLLDRQARRTRMIQAGESESEAESA